MNILKGGLFEIDSAYIFKITSSPALTAYLRSCVLKYI